MLSEEDDLTTRSYVSFWRLGSWVVSLPANTVKGSVFMDVLPVQLLTALQPCPGRGNLA